MSCSCLTCKHALYDNPSSFCYCPNVVVKVQVHNFSQDFCLDVLNDLESRWALTSNLSFLGLKTITFVFSGCKKKYNLSLFCQS